MHGREISESCVTAWRGRLACPVRRPNCLRRRCSRKRSFWNNQAIVSQALQKRGTERSGCRSRKQFGRPTERSEKQLRCWAFLAQPSGKRCGASVFSERQAGCSTLRVVDG